MSEKIIQEETIQGGFEQIFEGVNCEFEIKLVQQKCKPKNKVKVEIGDIFCTHTQTGRLKRIGKIIKISDPLDYMRTKVDFGYKIIEVKWDFGPSANWNFSSDEINQKTIKIYKEVSLENLDI